VRKWRRSEGIDTDNRLEELRWYDFLDSLSPSERDKYFDNLLYQTNKDHAQFIDDVNKCLAAYKKRLAGLQKPKFTCPEWLKGYNPKTWCDGIVVSSDWLNSRLKPLIAQERRNFPEAIRGMIAGSHDYETFFIPRAKYERVCPQSVRKGVSVSGPSVACLHWWVEIYVITIAEVYIMNGVVNLRYNTGVTKQLGCYYESLGKGYAQPDFWESRYVFYTPLLVLLSAAQGGVEDKGVEVTDRNPPWTTYKVDDFSEPVPINDDFARFIADMTIKQKLGEALLARGIIDKQSAALIDLEIARLVKPEVHSKVKMPGQVLPAGPDNTGGDYQDLVDTLTRLGYSKGEAMSAAKHVYQKFPHETLENKIKIAFQYFSQ